MFYDTSTEAPGPGRYRGAWGVYPFLPSGNILVSDMQNGLFVIDGDIPVNTQDEMELAKEVNVFPNPSSGVFTIDLSGLKGSSFTMDILDVNGRLIKQVLNADIKTTIDLSAEPAGVYHLLFSNGSHRISKKVVLIEK